MIKLKKITTIPEVYYFIQFQVISFVLMLNFRESSLNFLSVFEFWKTFIFKNSRIKKVVKYFSNIFVSINILKKSNCYKIT